MRPDPALTHNAADRLHLTRRARLEKERSRSLGNGLRLLLAQPDGRDLLRAVFERAGLFRLSHGPDPLATAFHEGGRNLGLWLLAECLAVAPEATAALLLPNETEDG